MVGEAGVLADALADLARSGPVVDALRAGIVVHGPDGAIVEVSDPACEMLGMTREQCLGLTSVDPSWSVVRDDGTPFPGDEHPVAATLQTGRPCDDEIMGVDVAGRRRRWISVSTRLLTDGAELAGVVVTFLDVTSRVELEHQLADSRARFQMLAEHASDFIFELDAGDHLAWVSPSVRSDLGWDPDRLVGRHLSDLVGSEEYEAVLTARAEAGPDRAAQREMPLQRADGTSLWVAGRSTAVTDPTGAVVSHVVAMRDITSQVEATTRLADSETQFRMIAENASDVILRVDDRDQITWAAPSVTEALGWPPAEVVGRHLADIVTADSLEKVRTARRAKPVGTVAVDELEVRRSDGSSLFMSNRSRPVVDPAGRVNGRIIALRDIHQQALARRELEASEARYRMLAENASDIVYQVAYDGTIEWVSPSVEPLLGRSVDQLVGTATAEIFAPEDRAIAAALGVRLRAGEPVGRVELRFLRADGERRWMSARANPTWGADGQVTGAVVGVRDCHAEVLSRRAAETLSAGNATLGRATSEPQLLGEMCAAAVDNGGYLFAWYGRAVTDARSTVEPAAWAGPHASYLDDIDVTWGEGPLGDGPTGVAIRSATTQVVNDFDSEPGYGPWRQPASARGFRSSISLPITVDGTVDGALTVFAGESNAFGPESTPLLEDLAAQLGFGLGRLRDVERIASVSAERALLATAIDQAVDAVVVFDADRIVRYANPAAVRPSGLARDELIGAPAQRMIRTSAGFAMEQELWASVVDGRPWSGSITMHHQDGTTSDVAVNASPVDDAAGERIAYVVAMHDLSVERRLEADLLQAHVDQDAFVSLMGTVRPVGSLEDTVSAFAEAARQIDGIDECFVLLAGPDGSLAPTDRCSPSLGPLEIDQTIDVGLLETRVPAASGEVTLFDLASEEVRSAVAAVAPALAGSLDLTPYTAVACSLILSEERSVGVLAMATTREEGHDLLRARKGVLVQLSTYANALVGAEAAQAQERAARRARVGEILELGAFHPVFQPVVDLGAGRVQGFEALTRFADGTRPDLQIREAHDCGIGVKLEFACAAAAIEQARALPSDAWLSINLSPEAIVGGDVAALLSRTDRPIVVEVTEHAAIASYGAIRAALDRCGPIRVAVDDAGAGYASLHHILELQPDIVKLDLALVRDIDVDPARQAMAAGLVHFAAQAGMVLLAEGVETREEARLLSALGVGLGQGYLFGKPARLP